MMFFLLLNLRWFHILFQCIYCCIIYCIYCLFIYCIYYSSPLQLCTPHQRTVHAGTVTNYYKNYFSNMFQSLRSTCLSSYPHIMPIIPSSHLTTFDFHCLWSNMFYGHSCFCLSNEGMQCKGYCKDFSA